MANFQNRFFNFFKFLLYFVVVLEIFFQALYFGNNKIFKKPVLFYNPYCDQKYWSNSVKSFFDEKIYKYHPTLSIIKKKSDYLESKKENKKNTDIVFYGSSFIDHKFFIKYFQNYKNYAVKSYGMDQIYLSYMLTKNKFYGDTIIFGFLPEDLDRALFDKRNYNKVKYIKKDNSFITTNIPIDINKKKERYIDFYTFRFVKSILYLFSNEFDYKKSKCKSTFKKEIFTYFIKNILKESKKNNQNLIFVTFSFQDEINSLSSWRYNFIKKTFKDNNLTHIDTKEIIEKIIKENNTLSQKYYSAEDMHYNDLTNKIITEELKKIIKLYK